MILHQRATRRCIRIDEDRIEGLAILMKPIESLARPYRHFRPVHGFECELEVWRADVCYAHERTPEQEVKGRVRQMEQS